MELPVIPCPKCHADNHEECPCEWVLQPDEYPDLPDLPEAILQAKLAVKQ